MVLERENPIHLKLVINEQIDRKAWNDFNNSHPAGNIFQSPEFFYLHANIPYFEPIVIAAEANANEIVGLLSSVILKEKSRITGIFSARSIIIGGPLTRNNDPETAFVLLNEYHNLVKSKSVYSQFRNIHDLSHYFSQFKKLNYIYEPHLNVIIDLSKSKDQLWQELHKERKRNIQISIKRGVTVKEITQENDFDSALELLLNTYRRIKLPVAPTQFFRSIRKFLGDKVKFFGGYYNNRLIAARIVLCFKDRAYDWYSASDYQYRGKYPNDLLPWQIFLWAKEEGYRFFDFGGAGKPGIPYGVRDYKLKFGGELVNYGRFEKVHNVAQMFIGKTFLFLYKRLKK